MSFVGRERWTQAKWLRAVRTVHAVGHDRLSAMPGESQEAKPNPEIDPRKLASLVRSRLKQGWSGRPRREAQTDPPLICSVLAGSCA